MAHDSRDEARGPLKGVRVLEMAGIGPGPFACMLLADLGADVLRIERPPAASAVASPTNGTAGGAADAGAPHRGDARSMVFHRGRPQLALDIKQAEGRARVLDLAARADILIEGFRPGVMERQGLGPADCLAVNPALVYGRMTGWGQQGPLAPRAGHDINYIALTGALHAIGPAGGKPTPPLNLVGDFGGGALYLALGVVSALLEARQSGRGQVVDAAIVDGTLSLMGMIHGRLASGVWTDEREANLLDGGMPWYATYGTADGKYIALGAIEPQFYDELCRRLDLTGAPDARERHTPAGRRWLAEAFEALFRERTRDEWCALLEDADLCFAPVLSIEEAARHPHNRARANMLEVGGLLQPAPAPRFSRTPGAIQSAAGEPTEGAEARAARWLQG